MKIHMLICKEETRVVLDSVLLLLKFPVSSAKNGFLRLISLTLRN